MREQTLGNKPAFYEARAKNAESSASIPAGTPASLAFNGTDDGLAVLLPSSMGSQALCDKFRFGVALETIAAGRSGRFLTFGVVRQAIVVRATRSDDSANWAGSTSIAKGVLLSIDTVNKAFSTAADTITMASNTTATENVSRQPFAWLGEDIASFNSTSSTATSYGTALTQLHKVLVRML